jgi:hypothetical protein
VLRTIDGALQCIYLGTAVLQIAQHSHQMRSAIVVDYRSRSYCAGGRSNVSASTA